MNLEQYLRQAKTNFVGEVAHLLATFLGLCHRAHNARFDEELPQDWAYGHITANGEEWSVRVYQPASMQIFPGEYGNLALLLVFQPHGVSVSVGGINQACQTRFFRSDEDARCVAGWCCDYWDNLLAHSRGQEPLPDNLRYSLVAKG